MNCLKWDDENFIKDFFKLSFESRIKYMAWILFRQDLMINFNIDIDTEILYQKNEIYSTNFYHENQDKILKLSDKLYWYFYKLNKKYHSDNLYEEYLNCVEYSEPYEKPILNYDYPNYFNNYNNIGGQI